MTAVTMTAALTPGAALYESRRLLAHRPRQHSKNCRDCVVSWPCPEVDKTSLCLVCKVEWPCIEYSQARDLLRIVSR